MWRNRHSEKPRATPLPKLQLFILLYFQLAEPITGMVISPFINQLIYEYGITDDQRRVGYYAGAVNSTFYLTEMICVLHWGRLSDRIGRRPVLMTGLIGLICSSISFGLSKSFLALLFSRALSGLLNGNVGVMKSMLGEITDESNQAQAFSFLPLVFAGGMGVASFMGGELSHPYERFPGVFGRGAFWKRYPYALPCFVAAAFCVTALVLGFFFLKESLNAKPIKETTNHPPSYEHPRATAATTVYDTCSAAETGDTLPPPPTATTPLIPKQQQHTESTPPPLRQILTPRVRAAILNFASFALLNIIFLSLQPLYMSTSIANGGLSLPTPTIGLILGINGLVSGAFQIFFFAPLHGRFGTRRLLVVAVALYVPVYAAWPVMNWMARRAGGVVGPGTIVVLVVQQILFALSGMGFSCTHIFVTSAAPSRNTMGATNGLAQSLVSLSRTIGPAGSASLFAWSLSHQQGGLGGVVRGQLVYVVLEALVVGAVVVAMRLPKVVKRASDPGQ